MKPLASIIIRAYNEEKAIRKCLNAVFNQKTDFPFEAIIVDSGSKDKTLEIASKFPAKIIRIKRNGFTYGKALNIGCEAAKGKYLVFLSAHAIPADKSWLKALIDNFNNSKIAGVYGKQIPAKDCNPLAKRQMEAHWKTKKKIQSKNSFFANPNSVIREKLWQEIKFNTKLTGSEDHEWAKRAQAKGYLIIYEPRATVIHSHNETFKQIFNRNYREIHANILIHSKIIAIRYFVNSIYNFYHVLYTLII